jgi:ABC-type multidrug transport system permease subunit
MVGLASTAEQFFVHYLVLFLMVFAGSSLGLLLGSIIMDSKSVSSTVPVILLPVILFSGFFKNREDLPGWISWLEYISPNKYGFIGLVENQVMYRDSLVDDLKFDVEKWPAIFILLGLGVFFRVTSLFFLWLLRKKNQ